MRTPRARLTSRSPSRCPARLGGALAAALADAALGGALAAQGQRWDERFFREGLDRAGFGGDVSALLVHDDGSGPALYVGGTFEEVEGRPVARIARWDGSAWSALGSGLTSAGVLPPTVRALVVFDDGPGGSGPALYVGGRFERAGGLVANGIARWDGASWSTLDGGASVASAEVRALAVFDDGSEGGPALYAGGFFAAMGGVPAARIARWDGASWSALGGGLTDPGPEIVDALAVFDDGLGGTGPALWVGGDFDEVDGMAVEDLAKWDGAGWIPVGVNANFGNPSSVLALEVLDDGRGRTLFVGGDFDSVAGDPASGVARWNGHAFEALGNGIPFGTVAALGEHDFGAGPELVAGGAFPTIDGQPVAHVARWDGIAWAPLGAGFAPTGVEAFAVFHRGPTKTLFAGGSFEHSGTAVMRGLAAWEAGGWRSVTGRGRGVQVGLNAGSLPAVAALAEWDGGPRGSGKALYAGGNLDQAGGVLANGIARWDGASWSPLGEGIGGGFARRVLALQPWDGGPGAGAGPALYVGGSFQTAGGLEADGLARWDGAAWSTFGADLAGSGFVPEVRALAVFDDGAGERLFAGGAFQQAGGLAASSIASWDGASWSDVGGGVTGFTVGTVNAFAVLDDPAEGGGPALYAGGSFDAAGGASALNVARWDGAGWSPVGGGLDGEVLALEVFDGALHAGGVFITASGSFVGRIARWDGASWSPVGGGLNTRVYALRVHDDGRGPALYAAGEFTMTAGGQPLRSIARWDGSAWSPLGGGFELFEPVHALASTTVGGVPALFAGGRFDTVDGRASSHVARWFDARARRGAVRR